MIGGKKGGAGLEEALPYPARLLRPPPPRALPEIRIPQNPQLAEQLIRQKIPSTLSLGALQVKISLDGYKEWIKATEKEVGVTTSVC